MRTVNQGIELASNIQSNLHHQNIKLKKAQSSNSEIFGDLSLGNGLLNDLENRRTRDRMLCKIVVITGMTIIAVLITLKFIIRH